uniref:Uncharacterized protein n=1 Tax=Arundo donax TaxID=35708 RepID=A0A0A9BNX4_ARUDO
MADDQLPISTAPPSSMQAVVAAAAREADGERCMGYMAAASRQCWG